MSIIYADTCKAYCHINNYIAKTVTEKSARSKIYAERGATSRRVNLQLY